MDDNVKEQIIRGLLNTMKGSTTTIKLVIQHLQVVKDTKPEELSDYIDKICPIVLEKINEIEQKCRTFFEE